VGQQALGGISASVLSETKTETGIRDPIREGVDRVKMGTAKGKGGRRGVLEPFFSPAAYCLSLYFTMTWRTTPSQALACGMHT
jgi:hypothetical protein